LVAATAGIASVSLSWNAPTSVGGYVITGYSVFVTGSDTAACVATARACTVTGLTNGTTYSFVVTATNAKGTSAPSAASRSVTPVLPVAYTATGTRCTVVGTAGADVLTGTPGNDVICGLAGNDVINGGAGNDVLDGGAGNDTINGGDGNDTLIGAGGDDVIDGGVGVDTVSFSTLVVPVTVDLGAGTASGDGSNTLIGDENVTGGAGNDTLTGDANANVLLGGAGNDTLAGGAGNDTINGGVGVDTASFASCTSPVTANLTLGSASGDGTDSLIGNENLIGGAGNDTLTGDANANVINSGAGNDTVSGEAGNDTIIGGDGNDTLSGGAGSNSQSGGDGNDRINGLLGSDHVDGGSGINICALIAANTSSNYCTYKGSNSSLLSAKIISGTVHDGSGVPVVGERVSAYNAASSEGSFTDASGRFDLLVAPGSYSIELRGTLYTQSGGNQVLGHQISMDTAVVVSQDVDLSLRLPIVKQTVRVVDGNGQPVWLASVYLHNNSGGGLYFDLPNIGSDLSASGQSENANVDTNGAGEAVVYWLYSSGQFEGLVTPPAGRQDLASTSVPSRSFAEGTIINVVMPGRSPVHLSGVVRDGSGVPVVGEQVSAYDAAGSGESVVTDVSGRFDLLVAPGSYSIELRGTDSTRIQGNQVVGHQISMNTAVAVWRDVDLSLQLPIMKRTVRVVDGSGQPLVGASVYLTANGQRAFFDVVPGLYATVRTTSGMASTNGAGEAALYAIVPSFVRVTPPTGRQDLAPTVTGSAEGAIIDVVMSGRS